jgi:16S rRNA (guanine527-N7)-methyltransferase
LIPAAAHVADIGSGAGLPGVVLAAIRPDLAVTLVDSMQRRCDFLVHVLDELGLANARVLRARAEEMQPGNCDVVVARAVAPLGRLSAWCLPWLRNGGRLLALKGASAADDVRESDVEVRRAGGRVLRLHSPHVAGVEETLVVSIVRTSQSAPVATRRSERSRRR